MSVVQQVSVNFSCIIFFSVAAMMSLLLKVGSEVGSKKKLILN